MNRVFRNVSGMSLAGVVLVMALCINGCGGGSSSSFVSNTTDSETTGDVADPGTNVDITWEPALNVEPVAATSIAGTSYFSSSKLQVTWSEGLLTGVHHYLISAGEAVKGTTEEVTALGGITSAQLTDLKSGTPYSVTITACLDSGCTTKFQGGITASGETSEEYWQIQGDASAGSFAGATAIVTESNSKPHVFRYGASSALSGYTQLYFDSVEDDKGVCLGTLSSAATTAPSSVATFNKVSGYGLRYGTGTYLMGPATSQAVPVSTALGGNVRLYVEGEGQDGTNRIVYLDSQDGYTGQDFDSGSADTLCEGYDYDSGGSCEPVVALEPLGNVTHVRQFKIGYPLMDDWLWDGAAGTFMVVQVSMAASSCGPSVPTVVYVVWDGSQWNYDMQAANTSCPKLFSGMQAQYHLHMGGAKYKMYYNDNSLLDPDNKPLKVIYADGSLTGNAATVDFEDWEAMGQARDINILWPDGSLADVSGESHFDDYAVYYPTNDSGFQVMYSDMSDPSVGTFIGMAVLVNP